MYCGSCLRDNALAGALLRLGHDRWEVLWNAGAAYVRTIGPPYYSLLAALERTDELAPRAFREGAPRVWVEFGATHPFVDRIDASPGRLLLIHCDGTWADIPDGPFHDLTAVLRVRRPTRHIGCESAAAEPWSIPVTLAAGVVEAVPTAWVVRADARPQVESFVAATDPALLDRYAFTEAQGDNGTLTYLRLRPSSE